MIAKRDVYKEIKSPQEVQNMCEKNEDCPILGLIYSAIYMCIRLLIDIRTNQVQMAEKLNIKLETKKDNTPTD